MILKKRFVKYILLNLFTLSMLVFLNADNNSGQPKKVCLQLFVEQRYGVKPCSPPSIIDINSDGKSEIIIYYKADVGTCILCGSGVLILHREGNDINKIWDSGVKSGHITDNLTGFKDLDGDFESELIISRCINTKLAILEIYRISKDSKLTKIQADWENALGKYEFKDLDCDGKYELVSIYENMPTIYGLKDGKFIETSENFPNYFKKYRKNIKIENPKTISSLRQFEEYLQKIQLLIYTQEYERALELCNIIIPIMEVNGGNLTKIEGIINHSISELLFLKGKILIKMKQKKEGIQCLEKSINLWDRNKKAKKLFEKIRGVK